jgi:hypothetical protein
MTTVRDVFFKVMREAGLSDENIQTSMDNTKLMFSLPLDRELTDEQAEKAAIVMRGLHDFAIANPEHAKTTILAYGAKVAANN